MTIEDIAHYCEQRALRWTHHIMERLFQRNITTSDVLNVLTQGKIIEHYPNDYPFPSCLAAGTTLSGDHLHVVCGTNGSELWLITAYHPDPAEWADDFSVRKERTL
jgi:hypothetical protein